MWSRLSSVRPSEEKRISFWFSERLIKSFVIDVWGVEENCSTGNHPDLMLKESVCGLL
jgi:hypothetical protein